MNFIKIFVGLLVAATAIIFKVLNDSKLFMLDVSDIHTLGISEDAATAIESQVEFSGELMRVLERVGSDRALLEYVLACPGTAAAVVANLTYLGANSIDHIIRVQQAEEGVCLDYGTQVPEEALRLLWEEATGGHFDWFLEETLRQVKEWLDVENTSGTQKADDGSSFSAAREMVLSFLISCSRIQLRFSLAFHRINRRRFEPDTRGRELGAIHRDAESGAYGPRHLRGDNRRSSEVAEIVVVEEAEEDELEERSEESESLQEVEEECRANVSRHLTGDSRYSNVAEIVVVEEAEEDELEEGSEESESLQILKDGVEEQDPPEEETTAKKCHWWEPRCRVKLWLSEKEVEVQSHTPIQPVFDYTDDWILLVG